MHLRFSSQIEEIIGVELAEEDAYSNSKQLWTRSDNQEDRSSQASLFIVL